jgi:hypothetical protein
VLDSTPLAENRVALVDDGNQHEVRVLMGASHPSGG